MKPAYIRIKEEIERQIYEGVIKVGEKFPSELEMARKFQVSRETFRSAVKKLEEEGKVRIKHGVGTFVIRPLDPIPSSIDRLSSTGEMIQNAGLEEGEQQFSIHMEPCQEEWAEFLQMKPGEPAMVIERIRMANDEPVSYNLNILPYALVGEAFERSPLKGSLMKYMAKECSVQLTSANTEIIVPLAADPHVKKLQVHKDVTVILLKQTHFDQNHNPVLFSYDYFRNDVFKFWIQRTR